MEKAEDRRTSGITGVRVDEVLVKDGKVCGVKAGDDEIEAHVGDLSRWCEFTVSKAIRYDTKGGSSHRSCGR